MPRGTAARWKGRYAVRLSVPRRGGWRAWGAVRVGFERALADPADPAIASAEIASEVRRGADYGRVSIALTAAAADVADALAIAWDAFRSAARDDLTGWEVTAAAAEVQPEPPLTGASGHHRPAFLHLPDERSPSTCRVLSVRLRGRAASTPVSSPPATIQMQPGHWVQRKGDEVSSALACVGLAVSDEDEFRWLVTSAHRAICETGIVDGVRVGRWQDDSGAALILGWQSGELLDFAPAYTAASGGLLAGCRLINESVAFAKVIDADGHQLTAMTFEAEQYRHLLALGHQVSGPARITALGVDVIVYPDADAFAASPGSQLHPSPGSASEPPPHYRENGWPWPPRLGAESFISHGVFTDPAQAGSRARLSGTVLDAARHVCALTGQPFIVAAVRTAGFEADLCLAASDHREVPVPGNIISGTVVLSAAIDTPLLTGVTA